MANNKILLLRKELDLIREKNKGFISPEDVLEYAKNPLTILHNEFIWDDTEAGRKYRMLQASGVIRSVYVTIKDEQRDDRTIKVREYVSLTTDRGKNGYRHIADVIHESELRFQYISDIQNELKSFRSKLKTVSDVADKYAEKIFKILESEKKTIKTRKEA